VIVVTDQLQRTQVVTQEINNLRRDSRFCMHGVGIVVSGFRIDATALTPYQVTSVNGYTDLPNQVQTVYQHICNCVTSTSPPGPGPVPPLGEYSYSNLVFVVHALTIFLPTVHFSAVVFKQSYAT